MRKHEMMAKHTSWKVGGPAKQFYRPADRKDLIEFLHSLPLEESLAWVGLGSNLLVRDAGFEGTVIHTKGCLVGLSQLNENELSAEAGVSCAVAARQAARRGLVGLEFFSGIPGTVGGALAMNAGAFGSETWDYVESVEMVNHRGDVMRRYPDEFVVQYRNVKLPKENEWFLAVNFKLEVGDTSSAQVTIKQLMKQRNVSQPIGLASCGSTFKNPKNDYAARLIESCHLKNHRIGGASVSTKHANFIINDGTATAADIEQLVIKIQETVFKETGVLLEREFQIIGALDS